MLINLRCLHKQSLVQTFFLEEYMKIAGVIKNSFVDFPGKISAVVFAPGCNMNCWYCHNAGIKDDGTWTTESLLEFLNSRKTFLDGVVFSGGEVTLQPDLKDVIKKVKALGLEIKLDTNGLNPDILQELYDENLLNFVAMDIKAPFEKYEQITRVKIDIEKIKRSIKMIMESKVPYEFRTTFSPDLTHSDLRTIAKDLINGAEQYAVQQYRSECYNGLLEAKPHADSYVLMGVDVASPFVKKCVAKGIKVENDMLK